MGKDKRYPEKCDISAIIILLATQSMIHLGEIPDPLNKQTAINIAGARFFTDLLQELKIKTKGNLLDSETAFLDDTLKNLRKLLGKKAAAANG
jgi:hypothetical protein